MGTGRRVLGTRRELARSPISKREAEVRAAAARARMEALAATQTPQVAPTETPRAVFEPQMVRVPAGPFLMGSTEEQIKQLIPQGVDKDWVQGESPQHTVERQVQIGVIHHDHRVLATHLE